MLELLAAGRLKFQQLPLLEMPDGSTSVQSGVSNGELSQFSPPPTLKLRAENSAELSQVQSSGISAARTHYLYWHRTLRSRPASDKHAHNLCFILVHHAHSTTNCLPYLGSTHIRYNLYGATAAEASLVRVVAHVHLQMVPEVP